MADVFVYAPNCEDFENIGLAGSLTPISCEATEIANGMWDLELIHPIDEMGKWSYLQNGYILVTEVPVRTLPEIDEDGMLVTSVENWTVKLGASGSARRVWNKKSGGKVISTSKNKPKPGAKVTVVAKAANRYKIKFRKGKGWIAASALENKVDVTIPATESGIEKEAPAWSIRPQRFRIYMVEKTDTEVTVLARHIFYDQAANITTYKADNPTCVAALAGLIAGRIDKPADFADDPDIVGRTNISGSRVGVNWTRVRFTEALLDPEAGLVSRWGAKLIRDDEEFCVLIDAGVDRGVTIEYGKNLIGVQLDLDYSQIVTRYIPIGQTSKGKTLELAPGTYSTDHGTIVIPAGAKWVDAPNIGDYPIPLMEVLDFGREIKAAGTSSGQIKDAREKLIDACLYTWEREQTNFPLVTLTVDFVQLGDTAEYAQYRQLENLYIFDPVRIRHPGIGIDVKAEVVEMTWDCLRDRAAKITIGNVNPATVGSKLPSWQLQGGIDGTKLKEQSIGSSAIADGAVTDQQLADEAVTGPKIANLAIGTAHIQLAAITQALIAELAVEINWASIANLSADIANIAKAQITTANIEAAHIDWAHIGTLAADVAEIARAQITTANIEAAHIDWAQIINLTAAIADIADARIGSAKIGTAQIDLGAITTALIATGAVDTAQIKDGSITDAKIVNLTASKLTAGTIDASEIEVVNLKAANITVGTINGQQIAQGAIGTQHIADGAISGSKIEFGAIAASKLNLTQHIIY